MDESTTPLGAITRQRHVIDDERSRRTPAWDVLDDATRTRLLEDMRGFFSGFSNIEAKTIEEQAIAGATFIAKHDAYCKFVQYVQRKRSE